jgi:Putative polyhydroxyalkanoic acid system protein (PHA_gran_rgn)
MPLFNLTVKHGRTQDAARAELARAIEEVQARFPGMVQRVEWSADRNSVRVSGAAFWAEMRVDPVEVHVTGDVPFLGSLLAGPIQAGLKQIMHRHFEQLPRQ